MGFCREEAGGAQGPRTGCLLCRVQKFPSQDRVSASLESSSTGKLPTKGVKGHDSSANLLLPAGTLTCGFKLNSPGSCIASAGTPVSVHSDDEESDNHSHQ